MQTKPIKPNDILNFWFSDSSKKLWFKSTSKFDSEIRTKYESTWELAANDQLSSWKAYAKSTLALCIVLDQFPLNMFRNTAKSFSTESKAIEITHFAISKNYDLKLSKKQVAFLCMPLMHSENISDQNLSVSLFKKHGLEDNLRFAKHHRNIIQEFGRFPHRNSILKRESTKQELIYLASKHAFTG